MYVPHLVFSRLIQDKLTLDDWGIPLLKDIPVLGFLFGFRERSLDKTKLLLLLTPRVLGPALDATKITDQMRRATPDLDETIKRAPARRPQRRRTLLRHPRPPLRPPLRRRRPRRPRPPRPRSRVPQALCTSASLAA